MIALTSAERATDSRTTEGKRVRDKRVQIAADLRLDGWAARDIAWKIGVNEMTARVYCLEGGGLGLHNAEADPNKKRLWLPGGNKYRLRRGRAQERWVAETELRRRARLDWRACIAITRNERIWAERHLLGRCEADWRAARVAARLSIQESRRQARQYERYLRWRERWEARHVRAPKRSRQQLEQDARNFEIAQEVFRAGRERWWPLEGEQEAAERDLLARAEADWRTARISAKFSIRESCRLARQYERYLRWRERWESRTPTPPQRTREQLERDDRNFQLAQEVLMAGRNRWWPVEDEREAAEQELLARAANDWRAARLAARDNLRSERREERSRRSAQRRYRWRDELPQRVSLDHQPEGYSGLHDRIADDRNGLDPFTILTGTHADHMNEVLGDLTIEDVARMDEWQIQTLRERLLEAGVVPSSVQRSERERLRVVAPHRGDGPAPTRQRMSTDHKSRKSRSQGHKNRDKRFDRRKTKWREAA